MVKIRQGFVSNSSSTSFMITNTSDKTQTLYNFIKENFEVVKEFCQDYNELETPEQLHSRMLQEVSINEPYYTWAPGERREVIFGDEQGTSYGMVFDYALRDGGESDNFRWKFNEYLR